MMHRRAFIVGGVAALAARRPASGQAVAKIPRVGSLNTGAGAPDPFVKALESLGYVNGKTVVLELRAAGGHVERLPALALELVQSNVDVIVAWGVEPLEALRRATTRLPIVMVARGDPVATRVVRSLARPEANVTGITVGGPELAGKRLELLREAVPGVSRVAVLWDPTSEPAILQETESAARALNLRPLVVTVRSPADFEQVFQTAVKAGADAMLINETSMLTANRANLAALAVANRLPAIGSFRYSTEAGFLMSYGPDFDDVSRRAAGYVDKILKGTRPRDLPIEQPSKFQLLVNLKTARALGLTIPPSLLLRADQVIE